MDQSIIIRSQRRRIHHLQGTSHLIKIDVPYRAKIVIKEILTKHKSLVAHYLSTNFDLFFSRYNTILMQSESYVTKRQSIKLLGEILLDRANYNVMTAYVDRGEHLKLCMNLLKDDRKMVQYEGFHVFKVCMDEGML
jgi:calcium binding protein 39